MKRKKGYVLIIVLVVMLLSMTMLLEVFALNEKQHYIAHSRENNLQSYYLSEGKILMTIFDEKYCQDKLYPIVAQELRRNPYTEISKNIIINEEDLDKYDTVSRVRLVFQDVNHNKELKIHSSSNYKKIKTRTVATTSLINELFDLKSPILSMNTIEDKYKFKLARLFNTISKDISIDNVNEFNGLYASDLSNYDKIALKNKTNVGYVISSTRDFMLNPYVEYFNERIIFLINKGLKGKETSLHINGKENPIHLSGVIYIEGDLEITGNFEFNGIIIVKDGKISVNSETKPKIRGMMLLYDSNNINIVNENIDLEYYDFTVYKYGNLLPGFIDINLKSIKNGGLGD